jgi:hypothetical protein
MQKKKIFFIQIPYHFDNNIILRQLRYTGMLETVRIRRAGYSVRIEYAVSAEHQFPTSTYFYQHLITSDHLIVI